MAGVERPAEMLVDGMSYVPALLQTGEFNRDTLFCHFPHYTPASSNLPATWVRQGDWKLIRFYADGPGQTDRFELYNLATDLGENHNLADSEPDRVRGSEDADRRPFARHKGAGAEAQSGLSGGRHVRAGQVARTPR